MEFNKIKYMIIEKEIIDNLSKGWVIDWDIKGNFNNNFNLNIYTKNNLTYTIAQGGINDLMALKNAQSLIF